MNEHTLKRGIVIAVVWMLVLGANAAAAYVVTTDSLQQQQSGVVVTETGHQPTPDSRSATVGSMDELTPPDERAASNDQPTVETLATDERPAVVERSHRNDGSTGNEPTGNDNPSESKLPAGDERSSKDQHHSADEHRPGSSLVESATVALGLGQTDDSRSSDADDLNDETARTKDSDGRNHRNDGNEAGENHRDNGEQPDHDRRDHEKTEKPGVGSSGRQPNTCTSGELLAKYEVRGHEFAFEKGTNSVAITDIVRDEGEPKAFAFETPAFVSTATVKFGPETQTVEINDRIGMVDLTREKHAISNVVFCQNPFYQVDFVTGASVEHLSAEDLYADRKIQFVTGVVGKNDPQTRNDGDLPTCLENAEDIEIVDDGTAASVTFDVAERCDLSLVSYETQSLRFDRKMAHQQALVDSVTRTFDPGRYEITVSLPDTGSQRSANADRTGGILDEMSEPTAAGVSEGRAEWTH